MGVRCSVVEDWSILEEEVLHAAAVEQAPEELEAVEDDGVVFWIFGGTGAHGPNFEAEVLTDCSTSSLSLLA